MTKTLIIFLAVGCLLLFAWLILKPGTNFSPNKPVPVQNPTSTNPAGSSNISSNTQNIAVVSTTPADKSVNQPLNFPLEIGFNRDVSDVNFDVSANPSFGFKINPEQTSLFINPSQDLATNTTYTISISDKQNFNFDFSFTTGQTTQGNTAPDQSFFEQRDKGLKETRPDLFLYAKTPYQSPLFSITAGKLKPTPTSHYAFNISLSKGSSKDVVDWLKSIGLSDNQINTLELNYQ